MPIKRCCRCEDGQFVENLLKQSEFICSITKKRVDYSGKCVKNLKESRNKYQVKE